MDSSYTLTFFVPTDSCSVGPRRATVKAGDRRVHNAPPRENQALDELSNPRAPRDLAYWMPN